MEPYLNGFRGDRVQTYGSGTMIPRVWLVLRCSHGHLGQPPSHDGVLRLRGKGEEAGLPAVAEVVALVG